MSEFTNKLTYLLEETASLGQVFKENGDEERYKKIELFAEKIITEEYMIGYAGHFSAGKSSMINALTGGDLLPSSPIPTSANIVKVRKSETDYCVIHSTDGTAVKYGGQGLSAAVKSFSKDGAAVSLVEIGHKESTLPDGITVMDTPGVDSTDDAHRVSTESALHLADLVFYTMDYNHVQSELNFRFTKELLRYNQNVYLIINQIDKHRESELPFTAFKKSVEDSFRMWGVEPRGIFYTSLRELDMPNNDFEKVKTIVDGSIEHWQEHFIENAEQTLGKLRDEHEKFLSDEIEERKQSANDIVLDDEWNKKNEFIKEVSELKKLHTLINGDGFANNFDEKRNELLRNAAITPYETRELLKLYLESLSSRFKVGLIFGAKKTSEEKSRRKDAFFDNLSELVHAQIEVHLKILMKNALKQAGILTDERSLAIDSLDLSISTESLEKEFSATDVLTGDAILNQADRLKTVIQTSFRRLTEDWKNEMALVATNSGTENHELLERKTTNLNKKIDAITQVESVEKRLDALRSNSNPLSSVELERRDVLIASWKKRDTLQITEYNAEQEIEEIPILKLENQNEKNETVVYDTIQTSGKAARVAEIIQDVPGFIQTAEYLKNKGDRLDGQEFTVALFGAFSAGKSSFSNALIGENILPVSPNPTTATINRIRPVSEEKQSGTADVLLKTHERMTEDVLRSFNALGFSLDSLELAYSKVSEALNQELVDESLHIHKAFISAFQQGYPVYKESLGTIITVEREEFIKFVAEENRSCFVESIDFFYDCELTRKGITLVDTPGADSINARHTDVAFDYIRNADAILFVTYYNHAFARADREFLVQLGRVKDAFELDKMFFIVNAIDLASNDEEAEAVKSFVAEELQKFGIRYPRVHGISSLEALHSKVEGRQDPLMSKFEEEFHHFLEHDLKGLAVQVLEEETTKATDRLASLISRTEANLLRKSERLEELTKLEAELRTKYEYSFAEVLTKGASDEVSELVYYILQRVFLRFGDFFKESYNPSVFLNQSADRALKNALDEAVGMLGFDVTQELKVTNLRMLNYMKKQLVERQKSEQIALKEKDGSLAPSPYEPLDADMLSFDAPFTNPQVYSSVNKLFKNQRSFFEKGERDLLRDRLEERLKEDTAIYLGQQKERLEHWANLWIDKEAEGLRQHFLNECLNQLDTERTLLSNNDSIEEWRTIYAQLQEEGLI
ncbi:dynamin family protein [Sporosarcina sp. CAU 1771]